MYDNLHKDKYFSNISRCSLFCFKPISIDKITAKLNYININENCKLELTLLNKISIIARGDLRKAINLLQNCNNSYDSKTNEELLYEFSGFIPEDKFNKLFEYIFKKDMQNIDLLVNWLFYC